jgi:hypothetical protein
MNKPTRKRRYLTLLLLLLLLGGGYGSYRMIRTPPELKKVKQIQLELASTEAKNWTPEQRQAKFQEMRTALQELSPAQRDVLSAERQKQAEAEMKRYAQMTPQEKTRHLDEMIDRSEKMRQQFTALNGQRPATPNGQRPPTTLNSATGPRGPGGGAGGPGGKTLSAEEREKRRKENLDRTTPEYRAIRDQFRKDMENRRKQRGLPVSGRF